MKTTIKMEMHWKESRAERVIQWNRPVREKTEWRSRH